MNPGVVQRALFCFALTITEKKIHTHCFRMSSEKTIWSLLHWVFCFDEEVIWCLRLSDSPSENAQGPRVLASAAVQCSSSYGTLIKIILRLCDFFSTLAYSSISHWSFCHFIEPSFWVIIQQQPINRDNWRSGIVEQSRDFMPWFQNGICWRSLLFYWGRTDGEACGVESKLLSELSWKKIKYFPRRRNR